MPVSWSDLEVRVLVDDYLVMLDKELKGEPYSKTRHAQQIAPLLMDRNRQSIEFKRANVSAILVELGFPYIDGYKPRGNYQALLKEIVAERLAGTMGLQQSALAAVSKPANVQPTIEDPYSMLVKAPSGQLPPERVRERERSGSRASWVDYLEMESRNRSLGRAGEELAIRFERARLARAGLKHLMEHVEHVSVTRGDGLGFDILSFDGEGQERCVEVKTTRYGEMTPFYATKNEVTVSALRPRDYHLYRVFAFDQHPKLFILSGAIRDTCLLEGATFKASPR